MMVGQQSLIKDLKHRLTIRQNVLDEYEYLRRKKRDEIEAGGFLEGQLGKLLKMNGGKDQTNLIAT